MQYADAFEGKPVLTVPREGKWYTLMVLFGPEGEGATLEISFGYLHDHCGVESPYRDHVPNPVAVVNLCQANGFVMGPQALAEMQARWADTEA